MSINFVRFMVLINAMIGVYMTWLAHINYNQGKYALMIVFLMLAALNFFSSNANYNVIRRMKGLV
jgi:hypothetical protein